MKIEVNGSIFFNFSKNFRLDIDILAVFLNGKVYIYNKDGLLLAYGNSKRYSEYQTTTISIDKTSLTWDNLFIPINKNTDFFIDCYYIE